MADAQSNIKVSIDTTDALASIKNLQRQISAFHTSMAKSGAAANAVTSQMQQSLINSINATGKFAAQMKTIKTTTESFTDSLQKNKFSIGEYFRYAGGASKSFGKLFKTEFDTINKVARENVKDLQTQYIKLGRDASGSMKAIAVRPLALDMNDLATKTMIASERQALLNQLLKQGSTNLLNFGKNTQWAGRQLMVGFTIPLITVGSQAAKTFMDMETQAIKFKKVYGDLFTPQEETQKALSGIKDIGKEFTKYGVAVSETVGLAAQAAAAGFQGVDLQNQTTAATRLSILGQIDNQKALETTISLQNAFGTSSADLANNIDFLNAVENQTVVSLDDITTAIPKVAPVIKQLGGNVKDLAFFMTAMKEGGINASEGANAIKSGLASMINPTSKASAMLAGFGININNIVEKNRGDLKKTVVEFATALNQLDPLNRAQAIEQMFGKFQFARLSTLFANVTKEGSQAARVLDLAGSSVQDLASLSEKELGITAESAMTKFKASIENLKLSLVPVGEEFLKAVTPIAQFVSNILDKFNNLGSGTKKIIVMLTTIVAGLGPILLMTFGLLANGVANIIKGFAAIKTIFNKTGESSATLGTEVKYMTLEQRNAAAVAASLDQVHKNLAQTFTSEAVAVDALTNAYARAIAKQAQFIPSGVPLTRGPIKKRAKGKPISVGGTGNEDTELALLTPGETVIPKDMSKKYGSLINGMIAGNIPGYMSGKELAFAHASLPFSSGSTQYKEALKSAGLEKLAQIFPEMIKIVSNLVAELPQALNIQMKTGAPISAFEKDYNARSGKFVSAAALGGLDTLNADEIIALQKLEDEIGKRTVAMAKGTKDQLVTDELFAKATREVIDENLKLKGSTQKAAKALDAAANQVGQVRVSASQKIIREGLLGGIFKRTRKASQTQNQIMFDDVNIARESSSKPDTFYSGNPITPKGSYRRSKKRSVANIKETANLDAEAYEKTIKDNVKDIYVNSRKRKSPHPLSPKDGKDDAIAYDKAAEKELNKRKRSSKRAQGPATIGPAIPTGVNELNIVSKLTAEEQRKQSKKQLSGKLFGGMKTVGSKLGTRLGGGTALLGANMALAAMPNFAGKELVQSTMTGANMGMLFGPWGAAAGAAIGLVTSAVGALIAKEKEHRATAEASFKASADIATFFGNQVANTDNTVNNFKVTSISTSQGVNNLGKSISYSSKELANFKALIDSLPKDNPLSQLVKGLTNESNPAKVKELAQTFVQMQVAVGNIKPEQAQKTLNLILSASNKAALVGSTFINLKTQTSAVISVLKTASENSGQLGTSLTQLTAAAANSSSLEQLKSILDGVAGSGISAARAFDAMFKSYMSVGNVDAARITRQLKNIKGADQSDLGLLMNAASLGYKTQLSSATNIVKEREKAYAYIAKNQGKNSSGSNIPAIQPYQSQSSSIKNQNTEYEKSIKLLQKKKKLIDDEIAAQKKVTDELKRQHDFDSSQAELESQIVDAKIRGNFLEVARLKQLQLGQKIEYQQGQATTPLEDKSAELQKQIDAYQEKIASNNETIDRNTIAVNNLTDAYNNSKTSNNSPGNGNIGTTEEGAGTFKDPFRLQSKSFSQEYKKYTKDFKPSIATPNPVSYEKYYQQNSAGLDPAKAKSKTVREAIYKYALQNNRIEGEFFSLIGSDGLVYKFRMDKDSVTRIGKPTKKPNVVPTMSAVKKAMGGLIKGPGTGTSDSIRATLGYAGGGNIHVSNGEYIVKASSVKQYGISTMNSINNGTAEVGTKSGNTVYNINMNVSGVNDPQKAADIVMHKLNLVAAKNNKNNRISI